MLLSDLVALKPGVYQLEKGHGKWYQDQCNAVVILFAGSETELAPTKFKDDEEIL